MLLWPTQAQGSVWGSTVAVAVGLALRISYYQSPLMSMMITGVGRTAAAGAAMARAEARGVVCFTVAVCSVRCCVRALQFLCSHVWWPPPPLCGCSLTSGSRWPPCAMSSTKVLCIVWLRVPKVSHAVFLPFLRFLCHSVSTYVPEVAHNVTLPSVFVCASHTLLKTYCNMWCMRYLFSKTLHPLLTRIVFWLHKTKGQDTYQESRNFLTYSVSTNRPLTTTVVYSTRGLYPAYFPLGNSVLIRVDVCVFENKLIILRWWWSYFHSNGEFDCDLLSYDTL